MNTLSVPQSRAPRLETVAFSGTRDLASSNGFFSTILPALFDPTLAPQQVQPVAPAQAPLPVVAPSIRPIGSSPSALPTAFYPPVNLKFGAFPAYEGPFDSVWTLTDFEDQTSNARIFSRFLKVLKFVQRERKAEHELQGFSYADPKATNDEGFLQHESITDIPERNIDYASAALFELARERNDDLFIHVTDPGVGAGGQAHKRSILVSENHGVHVGPNNGTLGLLSQYLDNTGEQYHIYEIDPAKVADLESLRPDSVPGKIGSTFHGRDVFGVVAAALAGGIAPESLATEASVRESLPAVIAPFGRSVSLPAKGENAEVRVNRDNTSGNLVINVPVDQETFEQLLQSNARFVVENPQNGKQIEVPLVKTFGNVGNGEGLIYLGSKGSPKPGQNYLEIAINGGDASRKLALPSVEGSGKLLLKRVG